MADLVLHLRGQRELPLQRRRAEDPLALGQHAHELGVAVHLDELDELRAVLVGHPVVGLDLAARLDVLEELLRARRCSRAGLPAERSLGYRVYRHATRGADPAGRPPLRRAGLPRHVHRRPRRGDGRAEGRRSTRTSRSKQDLLLRDHARGRGRVPRGARRDPGGRCRAPSGSGWRCARTCASSPTSSTSPPCSCASGATSRASGARRSSPSAAGTRSACARSSARASSAASSARTSTRRPPRCSRSRRQLGVHVAPPGRDTDELADRFARAARSTAMRGYASPCRQTVSSMRLPSGSSTTDS